MEFTGRLITGDFEENTMTFEIEGEMTLQAGRYKIVQIEVGNQVKNNVALADVVVSAIDEMSDTELKEEERLLNNEIAALEGRLANVENERFYRKNPECRKHYTQRPD